MARSVWLLTLVFWLCVGIHNADAQWMNQVPRATRGYPQTFLDACLNLDAWPSVRSVTEYLGSFTHDLDAGDDPSLAACFSNMRAAGLKLSIEAAAFQPGSGCGLGVECFNSQVPLFNRLIALGAPQILIRLQEPLTEGRKGGWALDDIVFQTTDYVYHIRQNYTDFKVSSVEAYPFNSVHLLHWWIARLHEEARAWGIAPPEYFEVDHDRNACCWSWSDVWILQDSARSFGWGFAYIFGSPVAPGETWHQSALRMGTGCWANEIVPDLYTFESWEPSDPPRTIPETEPGQNGVFMGTVRDFRTLGLFPR